MKYTWHSNPPNNASESYNLQLRQPRKICYAAYSATKIVKNSYISFKIANFAFNIKI